MGPVSTWQEATPCFLLSTSGRVTRPPPHPLHSRFLRTVLRYRETAIDYWCPNVYRETVNLYVCLDRCPFGEGSVRGGATYSIRAESVASQDTHSRFLRTFVRYRETANDYWCPKVYRETVNLDRGPSGEGSGRGGSLTRFELRTLPLKAGRSG